MFFSGFCFLSSPRLMKWVTQRNHWKKWNKKPVRGGNGAPWRMIRVGETLHRVHDYKIAFKRYFPKAQLDEHVWNKKHRETSTYLKEKFDGKRESNPNERALMKHEIRALMAQEGVQ